MTTNNEPITVECAAGGTLNVNPGRAVSRPTCKNCAQERDAEAFKCKNCGFNLSTGCVENGYGDIHKDRCWGGVVRKGVVNFVCTCKLVPMTTSCDKCWPEKIKKYTCFNCGPPNKATLACEKCLNHFVCSVACYNMNRALTQSHATTCCRSLPVWCGHGKALLCSPPCGCTMCMHGMWSEDCFICITNKHNDSVIKID